VLPFHRVLTDVMQFDELPQDIAQASTSTPLPGEISCQLWVALFHSMAAGH